MGQPQIPVLNGATPAPPSGYQNARWQQGASLGNDPVYGVPRIPDSCYVPSAGGASVKTANYPATIADMGKLLSFNSASAVTLTLPNPLPLNALSTPTTETRWNIQVQNIGAGALTINPDGLDLDGSASSLVLTQNQGVSIYTDGTNYLTERGAGANTTGLATIAGVQDESYTYSADTGTANAYAQTLTPTPTVTAGLSGKFKAAHANTGASTHTVAGTTASLVKTGAQPLVAGDISVNQVVEWTYDGTNFQTGNISSSAVTSIALTVPSIMSVSGSPVTGAGTLAVSLVTESANTVFAGPSSGSAAVPTFRSLTAQDLPAATTPAQIRGFNANSASSGTSLAVTWPSGTVAGDEALLNVLNGGSGGGVPTGWTQISSNFPVGFTATKVLNSTDITAGGVTVSGSIAGFELLQIVTCKGPTAGSARPMTTVGDLAVSH